MNVLLPLSRTAPPPVTSIAPVPPIAPLSWTKTTGETKNPPVPPAASVNGMLLAPPSPNSSVPVWPLEPSVTLVLLPNAPFVLALLIGLFVVSVPCCTARPPLKVLISPGTKLRLPSPVLVSAKLPPMALFSRRLPPLRVTPIVALAVRMVPPVRLIVEKLAVESTSRPRCRCRFPGD